MSATLTVATSPRAHARVARALRRGPYFDLEAFSTKMTRPARLRYGYGPAEAAPAAILLWMAVAAGGIHC